MMEHMFLDVNTLDLNIIKIWLLHSVKVIQDDGTHVFGCKSGSTSGPPTDLIIRMILKKGLAVNWRRRLLLPQH
jgi:hypothetical protein